MFSLSDFNYQLPPELIAHYPTSERSASRLLCVENENLSHKHFYDLPDQLNQNDLLVLNDTRVFPARLFGQKETGGKVEILVERILQPDLFFAHVRASKAPLINSKISIGEFTLEVLSKNEDLYELKILENAVLDTLLAQHGHIPLPPYLNRTDEILDQERYQTVYANQTGSAAAPTAGLHFDHDLLKKIKEKGIELAFVTLHVGAGTFQPVRTENLAEHVMHSERVEVPAITCEKIKAVKKKGGRIVAVGTTTVRSLETAALQGEIQPFCGETQLFITPGFPFNCVDVLLTNFHLPKSTLLMLVCAFGGYEKIMRAYQEAIEKQYRFFSYGDAMWVTRASNLRGLSSFKTRMNTSL